MFLETILFYIFSGMAIISAILVIQRKNPISSAIFLILTFLSIAGLFFLLSAHLIGILQILVYPGAIIVLILFVIMLLNLTSEELGKRKITLYKVLSIITSLIFIGLFLKMPYININFPKLPKNFGEIKEVGEILYTNYALPLEIVGILLLVAMIGVVILGKWSEE